MPRDTAGEMEVGGIVDGSAGEVCGNMGYREAWLGKRRGGNRQHLVLLALANLPENAVVSSSVLKHKTDTGSHALPYVVCEMSIFKYCFVGRAFSTSYLGSQQRTKSPLIQPISPYPVAYI